ncbi:MAG: type II secretion system protein [Candidatus Kerfeldbacteria bacterium]
MQSGAGYTLIEILISMAIFVVIGGIAVFGFRGASQVNTIRQNAEAFVSDLHRLQTLALNGGGVMTCSTQTPLVACAGNDECASGECNTLASPPGGFGVVINGDNQSYTLFAEMTAVDANPADFNSGTDPLLQAGQVTLNDDVEFSSVSYSDAGASAVTFQTLRGTASSDATFCFSRPGITGIFQMVKVIGAVGLIQSTSIRGDQCPPP